MVVHIIIYLLLSVTGLTFIKLGGNLQGGLALGLQDSVLRFSIGTYTLIGFVCYIASFILNMFLVQKNNLTYIVPVTTGLSYAMVMFVGAVLLKETVSPLQWTGIGVVLVGIVLMNIK